MCARRVLPAPPAAVVWRDGVHVVGTVVWCDAPRARGACFLSEPQLGRHIHQGPSIGTREALALARAKPGALLPVPYRRPFTLGTLRLELISNGVALGSAGLLIDRPSARVLYLGRFANQHYGMAEPAELRTCDAVVARIDPLDGADSEVAGGRRHRLDGAARGRAAAAALAAWASRPGTQVANVVLVSSVGKALDVTWALTEDGLQVVASPAVAKACALLAAIVPTVPKPKARLPGPGQVMVAFAHEQARLRGRSELAAAQWACVVEQRGAPVPQVDTFVWRSTCTREEWLEVLTSTRAERFYLVGDGADSLARSLGARARVLGPPTQMPLFAA